MPRKEMNPAAGGTANGAWEGVFSGELDGSEHTPHKGSKASRWCAQKAWHRRNPWAGWSHSAVRSAEKRGLIVRPEACEGCGAIGPVDAHHDDHRDPLRVTWWCRRCHRRHHADERRRAGK